MSCCLSQVVFAAQFSPVPRQFVAKRAVKRIGFESYGNLQNFTVWYAAL